MLIINKLRDKPARRVWIVERGWDYEGSDIQSVFAELPAAEQYVQDNRDEEDGSNWTISEWKVE
jgi:hypothetical protein